MKKLTILAALVLSSQAMALDTVMGLKGRFDYVHTGSETTPGTKSSSGILTTSFLRLATQAKLNETTEAKLVLDFQPTPTADNGTSTLIDEAYIEKTMGPLSAIFGKQAIMTGGRENDHSSRDLYLTSSFRNIFVKKLTGASVGYSHNGQNIYLQYLQQSDANKGVLTDKKILGLAFYTEFMDKLIMPTVSYHKIGTSRIGDYDNAGSIGVRVNVGALAVELDYLMLEQEKLTASGDAKLNSIVAHVRYYHEGFQPFVKFIKENGKKGYSMAGLTGSDKTERTAYEAGLEYYPVKDEEFRYQVVYNNSDAKNSNGPALKVEDQKIYAGVAFNYNILK